METVVGKATNRKAHQYELLPNVLPERHEEFQSALSSGNCRMAVGGIQFPLSDGSFLQVRPTREIVLVTPEKS